MKYKVMEIQEDVDFGCEERSEGSPVIPHGSQFLPEPYQSRSRFHPLPEAFPLHGELRHIPLKRKGFQASSQDLLV